MEINKKEEWQRQRKYQRESEIDRSRDKKRKKNVYIYKEKKIRTTYLFTNHQDIFPNFTSKNESEY